jgi:hypothetical protein
MVTDGSSLFGLFLASQEGGGDRFDLRTSLHLNTD